MKDEFPRVLVKLGTRATKATCPICKKQDKWSWIDLNPPYICEVCGYSMLAKRCINYTKNIVMPLRKTERPVRHVQNLPEFSMERLDNIFDKILEKASPRKWIFFIKRDLTKAKKNRVNLQS